MDKSLEVLMSDFIRKERLPEDFRKTFSDYYAPLADWIYCTFEGQKCPVIGVNGAQGTGKSTLCAALKLLLEQRYQWRVAVLSIDDIYLTHRQRVELAQSVHPLLVTRGVPGTHDLTLGNETIDNLKNLTAGQAVKLPRFNKAEDDREPIERWEAIEGPVDLVLFEGWCVASEPSTVQELTQAVNPLEENEDRDSRWRTYVNDQLAGPYQQLFEKLDGLIMLKAPGFECVYNWRLKQEEKLAAATATGEGSFLMDEKTLGRFVQHYERITRHNLAHLPGRASVVLTLDEAHQVTALVYN